MKYWVITLTCLLTALVAVYADEHPHHDVGGAPVAHHQQQPHQHQPQQQPQQLQPAFDQPQPQRPYPLRRQSGLDRARTQVMGFFRNIMSAGTRLRRMATDRISTMLTRRSFRNASRRQDSQPQYVQQPQ